MLPSTENSPSHVRTSSTWWFSLLRRLFFVPMLYLSVSIFFFFNDTATTEIYTLSLHDALPISSPSRPSLSSAAIWSGRIGGSRQAGGKRTRTTRSEEHTSELQSPCNLVCRLLLEKKKMMKARYGWASRAEAYAALYRELALARQDFIYVVVLALATLILRSDALPLGLYFFFF